MKLLETHTEYILDNELVELASEGKLPTLHIWPVLIKNKMYLTDISIILNGLSFLKKYRLKKIFNSFSIIDEIISLKSIDSLNSFQKNQLEVLCSYGGHINVLYKTTNYHFIESLLKYWVKSPYFAKLSEIGINQKRINIFSKILNNLKFDELIFGFGHDGSPMFIFSEEKILSKLCNSI